MGLAASCRHRGQLLLRLNSNCARPAPALLTPAALPSGIPRQQQQQQQQSISTASLARRRLQRTPARQCRLELHSQSLHDTTSALPAIEDDNPEDPAAAEGEDIPETTADENAENADYLKSRVVNTSSVLITVRECRQKYPNSVLLVRVGDFYELYFDQADSIGGHILGLQVVDKKFRNGTVRFTGFPARSLLRYIEILVARNGLSVALCEQFMQPLGRSFTRRVTRVITPGTLIDDQCLANTKVHNYILCVSRLNLKDIEHAARIDRWHRDKAEAERKYAKDTAKAIAVARREWEAQVAAAQEQPVKRKPGRPPKNKPVDPPKRKPGRPPKNPPSALAAVPAREFDPSTVVLPDPPVIPPEPVSIYLTEHIGSSNGEPIDLPLGLAWLDVATGDFMTSISSAESLSADLARIRPTEILYNKDDSLVAALMQSTNTTKHLSTPPISSASTSAALGFGKPSVVPVADKSFHEFLHSDSFKSITTRFEPSTNMNSDSSNAYFNISAPSSQLVSSPEHLLLEASDLTEGEKAAACALLNYILVTQLGLLPPLQPPTRFKTEGHMRMSAATIQALEVLRPLRPEQGNSDLSLLGEIDNTRTNAGARLLAKRLASPSTDLETIEKRLDLVEFFSLSARTRDAVYEHMDKIGDIERALNKLSLNCGGPHDLLEIARTLREVTKIKSVLRTHLNLLAPSSIFSTLSLSSTIKYRSVVTATPGRQNEIARAVGRKEAALSSLSDLASDIEYKIREDAERDLRAFGFLKPNCSEKLNRLYKKLEAKENERKELQDHWRIQYRCTSLKLEAAPSLGRYIEVSKRDSAIISDTPGFRMIRSLRNKVRFENDQWTYLQYEIEMLKCDIQVEEMRVFEELRDSALASSVAIRINGKVLAEIDVAISMAMLATSRQYIRPSFVIQNSPRDSNVPHKVTNGRHPIVESQLLNANRQYVANDCIFGRDKDRVLLLTGPNMGGKSTYLRQIALISILGQVGGFVPADKAQLHILDAIYSRIGAHDNLALDQSTFMVEMSETADILKHATSNSLVILDEIGRGTSTTDGISIAYATLKYLHDKVRCKAIFATHYHELVPYVTPNLEAVVPLQTAIYEDGAGGFAFMHKVKHGICIKSHALYVAQIAGIPKEVLATAREFAAAKLQI